MRAIDISESQCAALLFGLFLSLYLHIVFSRLRTYLCEFLMDYVILHFKYATAKINTLLANAVESLP